MVGVGLCGVCGGPRVPVQVLVAGDRPNGMLERVLVEASWWRCRPANVLSITCPVSAYDSSGKERVVYRHTWNVAGLTIYSLVSSHPLRPYSQRGYPYAAGGSGASAAAPVQVGGGLVNPSPPVLGDSLKATERTLPFLRARDSMSLMG